MVDRNRRDIQKLDYSVLHKTGEKVHKEHIRVDQLSSSLESLKISSMDQLSKLKRKERKIRAQFKHMSEPNEFETLNEIEEYLAEIRDVKKSYLYIHVELEDELGTDMYQKAYKECEIILDNMKKLEKLASSRRRDISTEMTAKIKREEREERLRIEEAKNERRQKENEEQERIRKDEKENRDKIRVEEKEERLKLEQQRLDSERARKEADEKFRQEQKDEMERIRKEERNEKQRIENERLQIEKLEFEKNEIIQKEERQMKIKLCKCLIEENEVIKKNITSTCVHTVSDLGDESIVIRERNVTLINKEIRRYGDNLSKLIESISVHYEEKDNIINQQILDQKNLLEEISNYSKLLSSEVTDRGLSAEGQKSLPSLKIELQTFSGYESEIDIYSFQTEFEKLFQSSYQRKFLPDYLKSNYLKGYALSLVKRMDNLDQIWRRLKEAFGNTEMIMKYKLREIEKLGAIWMIKDNEKLAQVLSKLIFVMEELANLAVKYNLEGELYYNNAIIAKIYDIMGYQHRNKFIRLNCELALSKRENWVKLNEYLRRELKFREGLILVDKPSVQFKIKDNSFRDKKKDEDYKKRFNHFHSQSSGKVQCCLCGKDDHVVTSDFQGRRVVEYFTCEKFVKSSPYERAELLKIKGFCRQCLYPGAIENSGSHKTGKCYSRYSCKNNFHKRYDRKWHVLLCETHKEDESNQILFKEYKKNKISELESSLPDFSRQFKLAYLSNRKEQLNKECHEDHESAIYILQKVIVEGLSLNIFFDSGCCDLVGKKSAVDDLKSLGRASQEVPGPISLLGVGNQRSEATNGIYKVRIPLHDGREALMSGIVLDNVTKAFPMYPLNGQVETDICEAYESEGYDPKNLPRLPMFVGGKTDLMIGIKYLKYFPERIFQLPNGLTIYKSIFRNPDGSRGVVGGPHRIFKEIEKQHFGGHLNMEQYCNKQVKLIKMCHSLSLDIPLLSIKETLDIPTTELKGIESDTSYHSSKTRCKASRLFDVVENAGTEVMYRCSDCRDCSNCKKSDIIEFISIREEVEQNLMNKSVKVDILKCDSVARMPFIHKPGLKLAPNKNDSLGVYWGQVRGLSKKPKDRDDIIKFENKLQRLGFVDYIDDLSREQESKIKNSEVQYFIPWRPVWNNNSVTTRCRLVFDASQLTSSGYSLNSIVAKGRNNMNKLVEIRIRWSVCRFAYHTDIKSMYNRVRLDENDWCYQLYLWDNELHLKNEPKVKVIKTLIYGVKSSGNQAETALRKTAELQQIEYPRVYDVIYKDIYVDDCLSGESNSEDVFRVTDQLKVVLNKGGFSLKGLTFSGMHPPSDLSEDGVTIKVAGEMWYSKDDLLSLNTGELNFAKKLRGKKPLSRVNQIPSDFTRRDCVSKVAEVYDILGKVTPLTCGMKLDLRELVVRKLDWDDKVPEDLKPDWISNFETIRNIGNLKYRRAIVPEDAVSLDIDTIDTADASRVLACAVIYVRFKRKNGEYSCQMIFARSKILPEGITIPRAELIAAHLNATTGHVVKLSLGSLHKSCIKLTDSQVALHWISNNEKVMSPWVRNRVIEINRLGDRSLWRYTKRKNMIADLGTRKGAKLADITSESVWINGHEWMRKDVSNFPVSTVDAIKLSNSETGTYKEEVLKGSCVDFSFDQSTYNCARKKNEQTILEDRYKFCNYIIDPNRFRLRKVVYVLALVFLFIRNLKKATMKFDGGETERIGSDKKVKKYFVTEGKRHTITKNVDIQCKQGHVLILYDRDIQESLDYFFLKSTLEIKRFLSKKDYEHIAHEKDGILYYKGRILPTQDLKGECATKKHLSNVMLDLKATSFCVPLVDRMSPFAFSIVNEVHWYDPDAKHAGVETVLRYSQKIAHIIGGRALVKRFRKACVRCRILSLRTLEVSMGPIKQCNLNIAPVFYMCQIDICGPFHSYSSHNKRATVKIWYIIFCCSTTGAVNIKVMEDYSTTSFLLGFIRFACVYGYPKMLMPDEGSQLMKGCKEMQLDFYDMQFKLNREYGVEFEACPVGGHNVHGKVERKIKLIQESIAKKCSKERLSLMQWETLGDQIANSVNNLPIGVGNKVSEVENLDLITPNRLILGRNNARSPAGPLTVTNHSDKIIAANTDIFVVWFESWLVSYVPKLMEQPKWFHSDRDVKVGDVVLFLKAEKELSREYQYGIVKEVEESRDRKIRTISIQYRNFKENCKRVTRRSIREVVMVHPVDEISILQELGEISMIADLRLAFSNTVNH